MYNLRNRWIKILIGGHFKNKINANFQSLLHREKLNEVRYLSLGIFHMYRIDNRLNQKFQELKSNENKHPSYRNSSCETC